MSLRDDLAVAAEGQDAPGSWCRVGVLLRRLPDEDRDALLAYMADESVHATTIADVLDAHGHDVGAPSLQRHRRGRCACRRRDRGPAA